MENVKVFIDFLSSLFVLVGIICVWIKGFTYFKYKTDSTIRDLHIENAKLIDDVFGYFFSYGNLCNEHYDKLYKAYREATICLDKDIVEFIEKLMSLLLDLNTNNLSLNSPLDDAKRNEICSKLTEIKLNISFLSKEFPLLYRSKVVQDNLKVRTKEFWDTKVCKK